MQQKFFFFFFGLKGKFMQQKFWNVYDVQNMYINFLHVLYIYIYLGYHIDEDFWWIFKIQNLQSFKICQNYGQKLVTYMVQNKHIIWKGQRG